MQTNLLAYLEHAASTRPAAPLYLEDERSVTCGKAQATARRAGAALCRLTPPGKALLVFAHKRIETPQLFFAALYAGCFYAPLSPEVPPARLAGLISLVGAETALCLLPGDEALLREAGFTGACHTLEGLLAAEADEAALEARRAAALDTDPALLIFTSGSSGVPKGVLLAHRSVIDYIDVFRDTFALGEDRVYANQALLDYVAALRDIFLPLAGGGATLLLPTRLFSTPVALIETLNRHRVNTLCWASPALALCSEMGTLEQVVPQYVNQIFFTGSVFPAAQLRRWQQALPEARFVNHYGPSEITASCTWWQVDHLMEPGESMPIGRPFANTGIVLLDDAGKAPPPGGRGEICVKGSCLALGYYNDEKRTAEAFVRNPLQGAFHETLYKTGDIGSWGPDGLLRFHGRRDFQIKHLGHRIELSEIEAAAAACPGVAACSCLYHEAKSQLWLFYTGSATPREVSLHLRRSLPVYMLPRKWQQLEAMPLTPSGKHDVQALLRRMEGARDAL